MSKKWWSALLHGKSSKYLIFMLESEKDFQIQFFFFFFAFESYNLSFKRLFSLTSW